MKLFTLLLILFSPFIWGVNEIEILKRKIGLNFIFEDSVITKDTIESLGIEATLWDFAYRSGVDHEKWFHKNVTRILILYHFWVCIFHVTRFVWKNRFPHYVLASVLIHVTFIWNIFHDSILCVRSFVAAHPQRLLMLQIEMRSKFSTDELDCNKIQP